GEFSLHLHVLNDYPFAPITQTAQAYSLNVTTTSAHEFEAEFQARDIELKEDFSFDYRIDTDASALSFIAYRAPEQISAYDLRDPALAARNPDGYFAARAIFNEQHARFNNERPAGEQSTPHQTRHLIILFDTSLSMYGDKLARAVEALDYFLHSLTPQDSFNLVLFNEDASTFASSPSHWGAMRIRRYWKRSHKRRTATSPARARPKTSRRSCNSSSPKSACLQSRACTSRRRIKQTSIKSMLRPKRTASMAQASPSSVVIKSLSRKQA